MTKERDRDAGPPPGELPVYKRIGVEVVSGRGVHVRTCDGRELLDMYGGHAVALLGYGHPRLLEALRRQSETLFFQTNLVDVKVRSQAAARLAAFAGRALPGIDHVFLVNSGAEAIENALRVAFRSTGRGKVVCLDGGWHGRTAGAAALSYDAAAWYGFPRTPFEVERVSHEDPKALERALDDRTAALVLEPVQGQVGARELSLEFLRAARTLSRERGVLLVSDEIQCGMGRTGRPFAIQEAEVVPDLVAVAKGLAGGFPAGALLLHRSLAGVVGKGDLGTTFGGGPMAAALILGVLDALETPGLLDRVRRLGERLASTCRVGPVVAIQGRGLLRGLRTRRPAREVVEALLERGILSGGSGDPHVVRIMPPLVIEPEHVDALARALAEIPR